MKKRLLISFSVSLPLLAGAGCGGIAGDSSRRLRAAFAVAARVRGFEVEAEVKEAAGGITLFMCESVPRQGYVYGN